MAKTKNSRWSKYGIRYDERALQDLEKFQERKGFRNGARVSHSQPRNT